jgi:hypothetical protein
VVKAKIWIRALKDAWLIALRALIQLSVDVGVRCGVWEMRLSLERLSGAGCGQFIWKGGE